MTSPSDADRLARALELSDGFQVVVIFGPADAGSELVGRTVTRGLSELGGPVALRDSVPPEVLSGEAVVTDGDRQLWLVDLGVDESAARTELHRLNRARDTMASCANSTLVLLVSNRVAALPATEAPDLWSIRSLTFSVDDLDPSDLRVWTDASASSFEQLLNANPSARENYQHGTYTFSYLLPESSTSRSVSSLSELRDSMASIRGWTGWRPWWVPQNRWPPHAGADGTLECWMAKGRETPDPAHSDFWRASPRGRFFLRRGYDEDASAALQPGTGLSLALRVWRCGEALYHARQTAVMLNEPFSSVLFSVTWDGLKGRRPTSWPDKLRAGVVGAEASTVQAVTSLVRTDTDELKDDLAAVVGRLLAPLYDAFVLQPSPEMIQHELAAMQKRPVRS